MTHQVVGDISNITSSFDRFVLIAMSDLLDKDQQQNCVAVPHATIDMKCLRCGQPATLKDSHGSGGKSTLSRAHKHCSAIRRSMTERCKSFSGLKCWWRNARDEEKV